MCHERAGSTWENDRGPRWTQDAVRKLFGGKNFYGIPCGKQRKMGTHMAVLYTTTGYIGKAINPLTQHTLRRLSNTCLSSNGQRF